jgi:hypothetical protein
MMKAQGETVGFCPPGRKPDIGSAGDPISRPPTLAEAGIDDKNLAHRARQLRAKSDEEFEELIRDTRNEVKLGVEGAVVRWFTS